MKTSYMPDSNEFKTFFTSGALKKAQMDFVGQPEDILTEEQAEGESRDARMVRMLSGYPLLCDIPFAYLVPSQSMLKENEIRFFYLDHNWIRALLDGMMSLGRGADIDRIHDERFIRRVYNSAIRGSSEVRRKEQGKERRKGGATRKEVEVCTGFIMRSELVRGWRGLEFQAYGKSPQDKGETEKLLAALRIETLSADVLIGLYRGEITRLVIGEPPEGLYHGLISPHNVKLRNLADGGHNGGMSVAADIRSDRVVNVRQMADEIGRQMNIAEVNSAHIALQLLRTARKLEITESKRAEAKQT